jgi:Sulfotransferase family
VSEREESPEREGVPADERIVRLERELRAVDLERLRLRSELEQIRLSPLGPLIDPARALRSTLERDLWRLRRRFRDAQSRTRWQGRPATEPRRQAPHLSGSELVWRARHRLRRPVADWSSAAPPTSGDWLTPVLVDYFGRDGSTLTMALLATSPWIVTDDRYPYERRYFTYMWRWSRLLSRTDWPGALWAKDDMVSIAQERSSALLGPPPWLRRELFEPGRAGTPISRRCFELAWGELSLRAIERVRSGSGDAPTPRYYAEKHGNTWLVDRRELPPFKLIVLLRDPRDTYASIQAFENKEPQTSFGVRHAWRGSDRLGQIIDRQRRRLRWIAQLLEAGQVPVVRYEELTGDLPGVVHRIEEHLQVRLAPEALRGDQLEARHGSSPANGPGGRRHELDPETAERFTRELQSELRAVGLEA